LTAPDLHDGPVRLRELRDEDVPAFVRALGDPAVFDKAYSGLLAADEKTVLSYVRRARGQAEAGERILLAIADRSDAMVGLGMLFHLNDRNLDAEIGFWLAPDARGGGFGTRAVRLLTGWAMHVLHLERIYAMTRPDNTDARRLLERAGFVLDGTIRGNERTADGLRKDAVSYTMLYTDIKAPPDPRNP
jgi:RimJ/RimL family protein N-acetyltransferase